MTDGSERAGEGPWFDLPDADYARRAATLANQPDLTAAAEDFRQNGYLIRDFGFSDRDLEEAAEFTRKIPGVRVQDAWLVNPAIGRLATSPAVLTFLKGLYQREAFPFQTLNFPRGSQQDTHSDTWHFNSIPTGFMCGVWVALEDIHPDSGPLHYYPGSQKLPVFNDSGIPGGVDNYVEHIGGTVRNAGIAGETAPIRRGQAFIWAANLFHGGSRIADPERTRLSQVTHYYFRGCSYFTPLASGQGKTFWREPYDIAGRKFVRNADPAHLPNMRYRLGERLKIWTRRPHSA
jgi:ectoine hydroxylase-related dioxygenase (phytanoyl-CoA dioxygenase family)